MEVLTREFTVQEYTNHGVFVSSFYKLVGNENGWDVYRKQSKEENYEDFLKLPSGYILIENQFCGICTTDLSRQYLPWKLPQVTGSPKCTS